MSGSSAGTPKNGSNIVTDVLILGAGAAGLMCASEAAKRGRKVRVLDHANRAGKKILMSGGGRCNFTNYYVEPSRYLSHNPHFCKSALSRYTQWDFIGLVEQHGIGYHEKHQGQLFCDQKAKAIQQMLLQQCERFGAQVQVKTEIVSVKPRAGGDGIDVLTNQGLFTCESLVVATGGPSIPTVGATGFGYDLAKQFDLPVFAPRAGLVPFVLSDGFKAWVAELSGTAFYAHVSCNGQSFADDVLLTHRGLSGPAMLQISSYWQAGDSLEVNMLPNMDVAQQLRRDQHARPKTQIKTWLCEHVTTKLAEQWLSHPLTRVADVAPSTPLCELNGVQMDALAQGLQHWRIKPAGTEGYRTAEVALGGVDTRALSSKTMAALAHPNVYFIGEVVDVTGHLGGFNFQWAWSSAVAAGQCV